MKRLERPASTPVVAVAAPVPGRWPPGAVFALIFVATLVAYFPALTGDFLWDDAGHVTNPALQSWSGLARIWFEVGATQQYYPLLHSAFWLEHRLWGDATLGYHLINVFWHVTSACLLVALLRRLAVPGAVLAGLIFALHPVAVESVAWIAEQKNTLSTVLYLAAALAWLRFEAERRPARYAAATLWFVAALLTKTVTATLPAALLVVAWWRRGRLSWRDDVRPLLPWFALGAGSGLFTAHFEHVLIGAQGADFGLGAMDRLVLAGRVFWFYLGKLLWPADLMFVYPRWNIDAALWWQWLFPAAGLGLLAGLVWWSRRARGPLAAALLFGGSLFPVLGFVNVYPFVFSYVADHFQYLASLAVFAVAGAGLGCLPRQAGSIAAGVLAVVLGALTWQQAAIYRDNVVLYETTLRRNPNAWLAHHNLAIILVDHGRPGDALPHIERTLALRPDFPEALNNLGNCLRQLGRTGEAIAPLERAIRLRPKYAEAHNNLGVTLMALGREEEGRARFEAAVRLQPDYATAHRNLGLALSSANRMPEALAHFERAATLQPDDPATRLQLGTALTLQGRYAEALPHFEAAVELSPGSVEHLFAYGRALVRAGRFEAALVPLESIVRLNPYHAEAHLELAQILRRLGRLNEAVVHLKEVERLNPGLLRPR